MPSTFSPNLRLELIGQLEQQGLWNLTINATFGSILEEAITGATVLNLAGGDRELTAFNGSPDESRKAVLIFSGIPPEECRVIVPPSAKVYDVINLTAVEVELYAGGESLVIPSGVQGWAYVDGSGNIRGRRISSIFRESFKQTDLEGLRKKLGLAPINSPQFEGTPTVPTAPLGDSSDTIANTEFVFNNGVPSGAVTPWGKSVAEIPKGWALCDGENGTPDLRGRFILGASGGFPHRSTGGNKDASLPEHNHGGRTGDESVRHSHSGTASSAGAHTHSGVMVPGGVAINPPPRHNVNIGTPGSTASSGSHSHSFTSGNNSSSHRHVVNNAGESGEDKNMPPYYALVYIMKE